ncbi:MAG: hypothetical protein WCP35_11900 [Verrucomicrobiota bacterium]
MMKSQGDPGFFLTIIRDPLLLRVPTTGILTHSPPPMKYSILFAISLALAMPLYAGHKKGGQAKTKAKPTPEQIFNRKDKDHDGFLSKEEFIGKSKHVDKKAKRFAKKDTNHDSKLSLQEFVAKGKHHSKGKGKGKGKGRRHAASTPSATQTP